MSALIDLATPPARPALLTTAPHAADDWMGPIFTVGADTAPTLA